MKFGTKVRRFVKINGLRIKKHSPEILVVAGVTGTVISTVMACVATTKLPEVLDDCADRKEELLHAFEEGQEVGYTEQEYKKDSAKLAIRNGWEIAKLYLPAATMELASVSMIFASNSIHRKRTASLAAAYATLDSMFKEYRKNVCETFGDDIDHDMRYGIKHEKVDITEVDEKGKEHTRKQKVDVIDKDPNDPTQISDYAKFYDESCRGWDKNAEYNLVTLKEIQSYCNNLLHAQGYLFLNDVYKELGIKPTLAGQTIGWIEDPKDPFATYVDFGIFNTTRANRRFVNGLEPVILLDFNVSGDIMNDEKINKQLKKLLARK